MRKLITCTTLCILLTGPVLAQQPTAQVIYKVTATDSLKLHIFEPDTAPTAAPRPAIVFFFGGGWVNGHPRQFYPQAAYFASRGMLAIAAEYRIKSLHGTTPYESVADAKSAVRWIRTHADSLRVDPDKIVAAGGSAGGHIAATTGVVRGNEDGADDLSVSSRPAAMVLLSGTRFVARKMARQV